MEKQKKQFKPQNLQTILAVLFVLLVVGGAGLLYYSFGFLKDYAAEVNQLQAQANASTEKTDEIQTLKDELPNADALVFKADQLFATADSYQTQATNDITAYATSAGLKLEGVTFKDGTHTAAVSLSSPLSYKKLITFLNNIENNLPKLMVSSISLKIADTNNPDSVELSTLEIDVAVR